MLISTSRFWHYAVEGLLYIIPRVPECLSLRPNWIRPPPLRVSRKRASPAPPPPHALGTKGGGATLACRLGGRGEPFGRLETNVSTLSLSLKYRLSRYFLKSKTSIIPCSMRKCRHFNLVFSHLLSFTLDISLACTVSTLEDINNFGRLELKIFNFERINIKLSAYRINVFDAAAHKFFVKSSFTGFSEFKVNHRGLRVAKQGCGVGKWFASRASAVRYFHGSNLGRAPRGGLWSTAMRETERFSIQEQFFF